MLKKETKKYWIVGISLLVLTVVTVAVSYLKVGVALAIVLALLIATFKGSLVASFFMHLIEEKKLIYWILIFTLFCFLSMVLLIIAGQYDLFEGSRYVT